MGGNNPTHSLNNNLMEINNKYIVNSVYKFRNDIHRVVITNQKNYFLDDYEEGTFAEGFSSLIHPYVAYIFSFFDGTNTILDVYNILRDVLQISLDEFAKTIYKFIENEETQVFKVGDSYNSIPQNFLTKSNPNEMRNDLHLSFDIEEMVGHLDLKTVRNYVPNEMTLMLNNTCCTNCIYCYADRRTTVQKLIPFKRIQDIIKEASELQMRDIGIDGGDFFMYPYWYELLLELKKYEYRPLISTKFPITKDIVERLTKVGVKKIQLSLDSIRNNEIQQILKVKEDYLPRVIDGIKILNEAGIEITLKPVITNINDSIESIEELVAFTTEFDNIKDIYLTPADYSQFKEFNFHSTKTKLKLIEDYVPFLKGNFKKNIVMLGYGSDETVENKMKVFGSRSTCSGNVSTFFVLPDGKVTLCEQLYWHPFFIIGDLNHQSIMEMWNSEKAISLWNFSQDEVQDSSPCKNCGIFEDCRRGQGNCWRMAIVTYGPEYYDYPSPNCPQAPQITKDMFIPE